MELVFAKIGHVRQQALDLVVHRLAAHDPSHVRPKAAVARAVRIAGLVGDLVMHSVGSHPEDWSALEGQGGASCEEILKPFRTLEATVSEQAMIAQSDAETAGQPVKK